MKRKITIGGFTLIETLLSVALFGIILGVGTPVYQQIQNRNNLGIAAASIAQSLRRSVVLARASEVDSNWGVYLQSGSITLYKGSTYESRETAFDETTDIPSGINLSGTMEYNMVRATGFPSAALPVTIITYGADERNISVNAKGTVSY